MFGMSDFTVFHGNDTELILLVDPDQESLGLVVVDATTLGPVTLHACGDQVLVARDKEEMVIHQLLAIIFLHSQEWEVRSRKISPKEQNHQYYLKNKFQFVSYVYFEEGLKIISIGPPRGQFN